MSRQDPQTVEVGDQFKDNDRDQAGRVVEVIAIVGDRAQVVVVKSGQYRWSVGRRTWVSLERLQYGRGRQTGYTKVSRR